eukprot:NP_494236.1 Uncharacterized protein CELE_ZK1240.4 [Caenorhabditis elegans]
MISSKNRLKIKNNFDKIRQSVDEKEKKIIDDTTAEATRIRQLNEENITYLTDLKARLVESTETIEKRKNMNDINLYTTAIELPGRWSHWNINIARYRPADTKGMNVKLPNFKFQDENRTYFTLSDLTLKKYLFE